MHEVEVKLPTMHLGRRKRVLYLVILKLDLQESCVNAFCTFMAKYAAFRKMSPDSCKMPFIFLKNAFHIPEERHLGLASLLKGLFGNQ